MSSSYPSTLIPSPLLVHIPTSKVASSSSLSGAQKPTVTSQNAHQFIKKADGSIWRISVDSGNNRTVCDEPYCSRATEIGKKCKFHSIPAPQVPSLLDILLKKPAALQSPDSRDRVVTIHSDQAPVKSTPAPAVKLVTKETCTAGVAISASSLDPKQSKPAPDSQPPVRPAPRLKPKTSKVEGNVITRKDGSRLKFDGMRYRRLCREAGCLKLPNSVGKRCRAHEKRFGETASSRHDAAPSGSGQTSSINSQKPGGNSKSAGSDTNPIVSLESDLVLNLDPRQAQALKGSVLLRKDGTRWKFDGQNCHKLCMATGCSKLPKAPSGKCRIHENEVTNTNAALLSLPRDRTFEKISEELLGNSEKRSSDFFSAPCSESMTPLQLFCRRWAAARSDASKIIKDALNGFVQQNPFIRKPKAPLRPESDSLDRNLWRKVSVTARLVEKRVEASAEKTVVLFGDAVIQSITVSKISHLNNVFQGFLGAEISLEANFLGTAAIWNSSSPPTHYGLVKLKLEHHGSSSSLFRYPCAVGLSFGSSRVSNEKKVVVDSGESGRLLKEVEFKAVGMPADYKSCKAEVQLFLTFEVPWSQLLMQFVESCAKPDSLMIDRLSPDEYQKQEKLLEDLRSKDAGQCALVADSSKGLVTYYALREILQRHCKYRSKKFQRFPKYFYCKTDLETLEVLLTSLYSGQIPVLRDPLRVFPLTVLADKFQFGMMQLYCEAMAVLVMLQSDIWCDRLNREILKSDLCRDVVRAMAKQRGREYIIDQEEKWAHKMLSSMEEKERERLRKLGEKAGTKRTIEKRGEDSANTDGESVAGKETAVQPAKKKQKTKSSVYVAPLKKRLMEDDSTDEGEETPAAVAQEDVKIEFESSYLVEATDDDDIGGLPEDAQLDVEQPELPQIKIEENDLFTLISNSFAKAESANNILQAANEFYSNGNLQIEQSTFAGFESASQDSEQEEHNYDQETMDDGENYADFSSLLEQTSYVLPPTDGVPGHIEPLSDPADQSEEYLEPEPVVHGKKSKKETEKAEPKDRKEGAAPAVEKKKKKPWRKPKPKSRPHQLSVREVADIIEAYQKPGVPEHEKWMVVYLHGPEMAGMKSFPLAVRCMDTVDDLRQKLAEYLGESVETLVLKFKREVLEGHRDLKSCGVFCSAIMVFERTTSV